MISKPSKNDFKTLLYISFLLHPKYPIYFFPTYMYFVYMNVKKLKSYCNVIPCPIKLIQHYLQENSDCAFDDSNCIIISDAVNNNLVNNSFNLVKIHLKNNDEDYRMVHVISIPNLDSDDILMSDTLYFNFSKVNYVNKMRLSPINQRGIKIASDVEVCLVNTQHEINQGVIDILLKNYFQTPRILYKYDTFCVNIEKYAPDFVCSSFQLNNIENLYFKCKKVSTLADEDSSSGHFCVMGETNLNQSANIRGYLPASIFKLCTKDLKKDAKYEECIIYKCPHGLEDYMRKIETAVNPFLPKNKLSLSPAFLIQGSKGVGKLAIIEALSAKLGLHIYKTECSDIQTNLHAQTESKLRNVFMKSKLTAPCFLVLNSFEIFGKDNEGNYDPRLINFFQSELESLFENNNFPIILFCLSNSKDIASDLSRTFLETFKIDAPNQQQRTRMLRWIVRSKNLKSEIDLDEIGAKTHGFMLGDLDALVYHSMKNWCLEFDSDSDVCLRRKDFDKALDLMQKSYTSSIGAPKVPKVQWSDVGGLHALKREIMRTINLPLQHPNLLKITGLKRSGILLFGPPGTGKTLIAKAVATECGLCFLSVKGPELLNMYVGQSEQNVRTVFERAREASPCIIFFDELDSLAPNRGISGDSGGVMDRVVSQLLSEMDGLNDAGTVFIIGATNRPDLLDPALLRPGRFDKLLYVGPCADIDSKVGVLKALTRNLVHFLHTPLNNSLALAYAVDAVVFGESEEQLSRMIKGLRSISCLISRFNLSSDVNLDKIAAICPQFLTGADLYSVCANAWFTAVRRTIENIESGNISNENLSPEVVSVFMEDFSVAVNDLKPSISEEDMNYFNMLHQREKEEQGEKVSKENKVKKEGNLKKVTKKVK